MADEEQKETKRSRWRDNALAIAILTAALAAFGNIVLAYVNGGYQRDAEERRSGFQRDADRARSEATLILEMIKTNDPAKARTNLQFLVEAGLITDPGQLQRLKAYLANSQPRQGPSLPATNAASKRRELKDCAEIPARVAQLIAGQYGGDPKELNEATNLFDKYGVDPGDKAELLGAAEEEFGIRVLIDSNYKTVIQRVKAGAQHVCGGK